MYIDLIIREAYKRKYFSEQFSKSEEMHGEIIKQIKQKSE